MTIAQGRGITGYQQFQDTRKEGAPSRVGGFKRVDAMINEILAQLGTLLFGGTETNGSYVTTIVDDITGESISVTTERVGGSPSTNADLATQHVADINANSDLNGVVDAAVNGGTPEQVDLTFQHEGITYTVTTSAPGSGTLVAATTQTAGGTAQNLARFIRSSGFSGGNRLAADLQAASLFVDLAGFVIRPQAGEIDNQGSELEADVDTYRAGDILSVLKEGYVQALNTGPALSADAQLFIVRDTSGGDNLGEVRGTADGTAHVIEASVTAVNDTEYALQVTLINESTGEVIHAQQLTVLGDGTATETEIADAFVVEADLSPLVTNFGCTSANVSDDFELTAPLGTRIVMQDVGNGALAVADVTAFAMFTIEVPSNRGKWNESVAAGAVGEIWQDFV